MNIDKCLNSFTKNYHVISMTLMTVTASTSAVSGVTEGVEQQRHMIVRSDSCVGKVILFVNLKCELVIF